MKEDANSYAKKHDVDNLRNFLDGPSFICFWAGEAEPSASIPFLVYNTIPETGKGLISGQWGAYKTFTAIELAAAIMTGTPIFDFDVDRPGGVMFYACEGEREVAIRLKAAIEKRGMSMATAPFAWLIPEKMPLNLRDPKSVEAFIARLKLISAKMQKRYSVPLVMVIIDTVIATAGFTKPGDENDPAVCAIVMNEGLGKISRETKSFVFGIDHFGKVADTGTRGASSKEDNADCVLACLGDKELSGAMKNTRVAVRKARGGEAGREYPFTVRKIETGGHDRKGRPNTTLTIEWLPPLDTAAAGKAGTWTKALRVLQRALISVIGDQGAAMRPFSDGPMVQAVALDIVRAEFYKTYPATGETKDQQQDAKKKAFARSVKDAQATSLIGVREIDGIQRVWLASQDKPGDRDKGDRDNAL